MTAEIIGTKTGLLFGGYGYTDALGPRLVGVPARNFLGWLVVSLLILALARGFAERGHSRNPAAQFVGVSIIVFFALIALAHRMALAVAVAVSLRAAHFALFFYRRQRARRAEGQ